MASTRDQWRVLDSFPPNHNLLYGDFWLLGREKTLGQTIILIHDSSSFCAITNRNLPSEQCLALHSLGYNKRCENRL